MYVLWKENSATLWSHWQKFIILFIKLVCDIWQIDVNLMEIFSGSSGTSLVILPEERETLYTVCPTLQGGTSFPHPLPRSLSERMTSSFFILPLMLVYANNPVAHCLQAALPLIISGGWKRCCSYECSQPVPGGQLSFSPRPASRKRSPDTHPQCPVRSSSGNGYRWVVGRCRSPCS